MDDLIPAPTLPILAADMTRCHDTGCRHDTTCLRYLLRDRGVDEGTSHIASCVPLDAPIGSTYPMLLTVDDFN